MYEKVTRHDKWDDFTGITNESLFEDLTSFIDAHPEMGLRSYQSVLEEYDLGWSDEFLMNAECASMEGRCVMALLIGAYRADHFINGYFDRLIEKGVVQSWINRLKEIDEKGE